MYFRLYPVTYNQRMRDRILSRLVVYANLRKIVAADIDKSYSFLPLAEKKKLADKKFGHLLKTERKNIDKSITGITKKYGGAHKFYLLGADSYYYYRLTKKLVTDGRLSDTYKDGKFLDKLMIAPAGCWRNIEIHPYTGFLLYRFLKLFIGDIPLMHTVSVIPLILYLLSAAIFMIICRMFNISRPAMLISSIFFSLSPIFIQRSSIGWYDTDPYNVLFPLMALLAVFMALKHSSGYLWIFILAGISSAYSLFWQGWILLPGLITMIFLSITVFQTARGENAFPFFKKFLLYVSCVVLFSSLLITPAGLMNSIKDVLGIFSGFLMFDINLWPDIFLTVGELKTPSAVKITHILGGYVFSILALTGFFVLLMSRHHKTKKQQGITTGAIFFCCLFMAKTAERFVLFLLVPASICLAAGLDALIRYSRKIPAVFPKSKLRHAGFIIRVIPYLLLLSPVIYAHSIAVKQNPIFNEVWDRTLKKIRTHTPENSIINTWWPPGHFIRAVAERSVSFDGATLNTPQAYWIASFFLSDNEQEALGILRMLNSSGNQATEFLTDNNIPLDEAVALIKKLVKSDKTEAEKAALRYLPEDKTRHLLSLTHASPPPSYCLIYRDLIKNTLGLDFVKDWNFTRSLDLKGSALDLAGSGKALRRGSKENIELMWSIAGGRTYIGEKSSLSSRKNDLIYFKNGVILKIPGMEARINELEGEISGIPKSVIYTEKGMLVEKKLAGSSIKLSVLVLQPPGQTYSCIVAPAEILKSILFRLFYLNGAGLENFELFAEEEDPKLNTRILVYKITQQ